MNPALFTIATLTGHVGRCYGNSYTAVCDNGPARAARIHASLAGAGEAWGDPFEISTVSVAWGSASESEGERTFTHNTHTHTNANTQGAS